MKTCVKVGENGFYSEGTYPTKLLINQLTAVRWFLAIIADRKYGFISEGKINCLKWAEKLLLVKYNDNKMVKSPYNCVIFQLSQTHVANQQKNYFGCCHPFNLPLSIDFLSDFFSFNYILYSLPLFVLLLFYNFISSLDVSLTLKSLPGIEFGFI